MTQGYGPQDPNQPGYGQQPPQPPYGGQPPSYGTPAQPGYGPPPPAAGGYAADPPGHYMGRRLANWPQRVGAYLIDNLIASIPAFLAVILFSGTQPGENPSAGAGLVAFLLYLVSLGIWIYNRAILAGRTGQSWGKQVLSLRLVRMADGQPMGGGMAFVRDLLHVLDALLCYLGFLWPLWDARRQCLFSDKILNTVVLSES
ncbi:MAG TPA: RDD family protein [Actinomycetes bacterium]|nr:RDD family protein [Actinomycetes bacterium]